MAISIFQRSSACVRNVSRRVGRLAGLAAPVGARRERSVRRIVDRFQRIEAAVDDAVAPLVVEIGQQRLHAGHVGMHIAIDRRPGGGHARLVTAHAAAPAGRVRPWRPLGLVPADEDRQDRKDDDGDDAEQDPAARTREDPPRARQPRELHGRTDSRRDRTASTTGLRRQRSTARTSRHGMRLAPARMPAMARITGTNWAMIMITPPCLRNKY